MKRNLREPLLLFLIRREGQPACAADITRDDARRGLVQEKASAFKELHQAPGTRKTPFCEQYKPPLTVQMFGHAFDRVGGGRVDGKRPPVDHDLAMKPARLCG